MDTLAGATGPRKGQAWRPVPTEFPKRQAPRQSSLADHYSNWGRKHAMTVSSECVTLDRGRLLWAADDAEAVFNESAIS